jgi:VIT1/CCC1 family predicted Fe2+/Mn2+ transporter
MDVQSVLAHYIDEGDSAFIYGILEEQVQEDDRKTVFRKLRDKELEHQQQFGEMLQSAGVPLPRYRPSFKIRAMGFLARRGYSSLVMRLRILDESNEVKTYLQSPVERASVPQSIARDEAMHSQVLKGVLSGDTGEAWHNQGSGGMIRNVIYGFNDGLTANFGLLMGVIGSAVDHKALLLSGIAGLIADTLSMGASSYLASASQKEVYEHEIALERDEIALMPQAEEEELALLYQAKGFPEEISRQMAHNVMSSSPEEALREMTAQELGISDEEDHPVRDGLYTGASTFVGALIPLLPLFVASTRPFIIASFLISMAFHFGVGAVRSFFTGRGIFRSGIDMFIVGLGVAVVGYLIGSLLTGIL